MNLLRQLGRRLGALFQKRQLDADMSEEMRLHLARRTEENLAAGMSPGEARNAALRKFGGVEQTKERAREQRGFVWLDDLARDFRFGFRMLVKAPVLSAVIVLSLAVGLGANTAVFSWIRTVALEPLSGVREGSRLVLIEQRSSSGIIAFASAAEWRHLRAQTTAFENILAQNITTFNFVGKSQDVRVWGEVVSANFFSTLGVRPAAGRLLLPEDDVPGQPAVVVISHPFWQSQFGGRMDALGQAVRLGDKSFTIVGVAAADFQGAVPALAFDVWLPQGTMWDPEDRQHRRFQLMGRLRDGVSLRQANADVALVFGRLEKTYPDTNRGIAADVIPNWRSRIGSQAIIVPTLATLQTVTILLLLVVCTNTANLLLARATTRSKEIAIRLSVGAGRARVVRQLLSESLLLALLGAGLGTVLAFWGLDLINHQIPKPTSLPVSVAAHLDPSALVFSIGLAVACALIFGLAPALQTTRGDFGAALKIGGRTSGGGGRRRFQEVLVGAEIALTLVVVILAGLFVKSFNHARLVDPGFERKHVLLGSFDLGTSSYTDDRARIFPATLLARVRELAGVESAAVATWVPLDLVPMWPAEFTLEGRSRAGEAADQTLCFEVTRGYFETLQIRLIEGRDFSEAVERSGEAEAVINEEFARRYLAPGQVAIGRKLTLGGSVFRIVGVVRGGKYNAINETPQPFVYLPFSGHWRRVTLFVRTKAESAATFTAVKQALHELDPGLPFIDNRTMVQHVANAMVLQVIPAKILAVIGPLALLLAAMGLYSVLAYAVAQRTHEIGVRMTLGATTRSVMLLFLRQGMTAVVIGLVVGLVAAYF
ncbi:MAG: ABC transporter permease, partial [Opitutaceae bacterium]